MRYFKLPDLGEGLIEAEIVEWHVKAGDTVATDQIMLAVETAKAIVEIPSPQMGIIEHTFGDIGDTVHIGEPLVEYQGENDSMSIVGNLSAQPLASTPSLNADSSSKLTQKEDIAYKRDDVSVAVNFSANSVNTVQASPSVRGLASRLGVKVEQLTGTGEGGRLTSDDVEKAARLNHQHGQSEKLTGVRKSMAKVMINSHQQVVPVTLFGDAPLKAPVKNITIALTKAIAYACEKEPALNVWFDGENLTRRLLDFVDLGIAVDTEQGLFVPVLRQVQARSEEDLNAGLTALKNAVINRNIPASELMGATIILSNYGSFNPVCRYGTPIVVPPMVAIVGIGAIYEPRENEKVLPISLTFDHRCVTGGEAASFMGYLVEYLNK
ncbi:MAG: 2-oxoisovalerate dehydrogenase E2 component (dihydrolipoyl transacylase) [Oleispira sp.]|jgi:2-oxoisovalerate dehydrogenase E2 component (dihydrolipoyl transacylase)